MHKRVLKILSLMFVMILAFSMFSTTVKADATSLYNVHIDDEADLLEEDEENLLKSIMRDISEYGDVAFVTVDAHYYNSTKEFSSSYLHTNMNKKSCIVFVIDMQEREIFIYADGSIHKVVNESYCYSITDNVYTYATDGKYFECAQKAFEQIHAVLTGQRINQPMKYISNLLLGLVMALFVNYFLAMALSKAKTPSNKETLKWLNVNIDISNTSATKTRTSKSYSPVKSSSGGRSGGSGGGGRSSGGGGGHRF